MDFTKELLAAHADFKAGTTDFDAYMSKIKEVMEKVKSASVDDKAKAFDKMFSKVEESLTNQDEVCDSEPFMIYMDSDYYHYLSEAVYKACFGSDFYDFHNKAYSSGG